MTRDLKELLASEHRPKHYDDMVAAHNRALHFCVTDQLKRTFPSLTSEEGDFAFAVTGSDGRNEKSPQSKIELVVLYGGLQPDAFFSAQAQIRDYVTQKNSYDPSIECKNVNVDSSSLFNNEPDRAFPTRALDAICIAGNMAVYDAYKKNMLFEITDPKSRSLLDRFDNRRRESRQEIDRLDKRRSFDEQRGILYFDNEKTRATKHSHLRPVQYKLAADVFKSLRAGVLPKEYLDSFSRRTVDRLAQLYFDNRLKLSSDQVSDVSSAYSTAMYWYHLAEEAFFRDSAKEISVDSGELKEVTSIIKEFMGYEGSIIR